MRSQRIFRAAVVAGLVLVFALAAWFRASSLGAIPVHDGDESYEGIELVRLIRGASYTLFTTNGNLMSPFFLLLQAPFQAALRPSLWVLRAPAAIAGFLAIGLAYWFGQKPLGRPTALTTAVLLAALPGVIVYSRVGHEYCLIPAVGIVALGCALRGRLVWLGLTIGMGLLVHPINIFLLPIALPVALVQVARKHGNDPVARRWMIVAVGVAAAAAAVLGYFVSQKHVVQHLLHTRKPLDWLTFLDSFTRFLFYDYMTKPAAEQWHRWALRAVLASAVLVGVPRLVIGRRWDRLALLAGLAIGLGGFHFVVGPEHLMTEGGSRYGVVFVAPAVVAFACLLEAALAGRATAQTPEEHDASIPAPPIRVSLAAPALSAVFAGLMLSSMAVHWFSTFSAPGRETIWTFFDDGSEPFEAAYRIIAHDYHQRKPADLCRILAEDYWVSKPIEYYASWRPTFEVENVADTIHLKWSVLPIPHSDRYDIVAVDRLRQGGYVCLRTDSPLAIQRAIKSAFSAEELHSWVVPNINGRDVLIVYRLEAAPATNAAAPAIASGAPKTIR